MKGFFGAIYWIAVGVLAVVGIYASVFGNLSPYILLAALVMSIVGVWRPGIRYSWAALAGFGVLLALFLSSSLLEQVFRADWSCSEVSFQPGETVGYGGSSEEEVVCTTIPGQLIVASVVFWAITLFGVVVLLYLLRHAHPRADGRDGRSVTVFGAIGLSMILLLVVGGITLSVMKATAAPSPPERAGLPPNGLPVSCPEDYEDVGIFNGVGEETLPEFEIIGDGWVYAYNSSGSGALSMSALDEAGNTMTSSTVSGVAGDSGRSPRIETQGNLSIEIDAGEEVGHTVKVCDETDPSGKNKGTIKVGQG